MLKLLGEDLLDLILKVRTFIQLLLSVENAVLFAVVYV